MKRKRFIPFAGTTPIEDLCLIILLIPLWWILGIRFFIFHLTALIVAVKLFQRKRRNKQKIIFPLELYFLLAFIFIYILSLIINSPKIPLTRLLASLNNLSFWVMGFLLIFTLINSLSKENMEKLLKTFRSFALITSGFVLPFFTYALITNQYISIPSLLKILLPKKFLHYIYIKAPLLHVNLSLTIIGRSRLFNIGRIQRPKGFNLWATTLSGTLCLLIAMTLAYYLYKKRKKRLIPILILEVSTLLSTLSRNFLWLILALIFVFLVPSLKKSFVFKTLPAFILILVIFSLLFPPAEVIDTFIGVRKGSTQWRFRLYGMTFNQALHKPILGYGHKPHPQKYPDPIGSHSTYMGVLYKTGFLGLLVFLLFWISVLRKWWIQKIPLNKNKFLYPLWFFSGVAFIYGLLWMVGEDLDVPPILAFLYFIIVGLILSLPKLIETAEKK